MKDSRIEEIADRLSTIATELRENGGLSKESAEYLVGIGGNPEFRAFYESEVAEYLKEL